jgi:hypothetical protein
MDAFAEMPAVSIPLKYNSLPIPGASSPANTKSSRLSGLIVPRSTKVRARGQRIMLPIIVTVRDTYTKFDLSKFLLTKIWDKPKDRAESRANATPNITIPKQYGNYLTSLEIKICISKYSLTGDT